MSDAIVQQTLATIPTSEGAAPPEAEAAANEAAPPVSTTADANGGATPPAAAKNEQGELAKRFNAIAKKEANARRLEADLQAKLQAAEVRDKELTAKMAEYEEALSDPIKYYLAKGKDPVEAAKRFAKPETEEEKRIRRLEETLAQRDAREEQEKKQLAQRVEGERRFKAMVDFVGTISTAECPNLTRLYDAPEIPKLVEDLLGRVVSQNGETLLQTFRAQHGRSPTDMEIRETLEEDARIRAIRITKAQAEEARAAALQSGSEASPGPNGISNQHAAATSSGKARPKTLEERRAQARRDLTAALEAEAGERET